MKVMKPLPEIRLETARPELDNRPLEKRVGLIALATDHTSEVDFRRMVASERVGVYVARIPYANPTTPENLRKMLPSLSAGAALILPDEPLEAVCYSCTSASVVIGDAEIEAAIREAKPGVPVVTPPMAGARGLNAFGVKRISILTPYTVDRRGARAGAERRIVHRRHDDDRAGDVFWIERAGKLVERQWPFILVAMIAAGKQRRRAIAVADDADRDHHRAPGGIVAAVGQAQETVLDAVVLEIDGRRYRRRT